jgi:hypothetical protein
MNASRTIAGLRTDTAGLSLCRSLRGSGSSLVGSGFLGLTPPGYELAPRTGLGKAGQRRLDEHKVDAKPTFHHPSLALG